MKVNCRELPTLGIGVGGFLSISLLINCFFCITLFGFSTTGEGVLIGRGELTFPTVNCGVGNRGDMTSGNGESI